MIGTRDAPLISIIIPCYNQARYLADAIKSALAQTHSPVQVVVVDDGSVDNTAEVASHYPERLLCAAAEPRCCQGTQHRVPP